MNKRIFTAEQIVGLRKNGNVAKCSDKAITYNKDFRVLAVKRYQDDGVSARQIFKEAGFDLDVIGKDNPKYCLRDWMRTLKTKGSDWLSMEHRGQGGGRPKVSKMTNKKKKD